MSREQIIRELSRYFSLSELVCPHTKERLDERAWNVFRTELLELLLVLRRDILQVPLVCNTYGTGGSATQRGYRCNWCELVREKTGPFIDPHSVGAAVDLVSPRMNVSEMNRLIDANTGLLPCHIRLEKDVSWLHVDVYDWGVPVYRFKA